MPFGAFAPETEFVNAAGEMIDHVDGLITAQQLAQGIHALSHSQ